MPTSLVRWRKTFLSWQKIPYSISNSQCFRRPNGHHFFVKKFVLSSLAYLARNPPDQYVKPKITAEMTAPGQHFEKFDHVLAPAWKKQKKKTKLLYHLAFTIHNNKNIVIDLPQSTASRILSLLSSHTRIYICHYRIVLVLST